MPGFSQDTVSVLGGGGWKGCLSLLAKITTMKSVPVEDCVRVKAELGVFFSNDGKEGKFCSKVFFFFFYIMLTGPQMSLE